MGNQQLTKALSMLCSARLMVEPETVASCSFGLCYMQLLNVGQLHLYSAVKKLSSLLEIRAGRRAGEGNLGGDLFYLLGNNAGHSLQCSL